LYLAVITVCASVSQGIMGKSHRRPENPCRNVCVHMLQCFSVREIWFCSLLRCNCLGTNSLLRGFGWLLLAW